MQTRRSPHLMRLFYTCRHQHPRNAMGTQKGLKLDILVYQANYKFKCPVCQKRYNVKSAYKIHLTSHTQEKTHKCRTCGNEYRHLKDLIYHRRNVHSGIDYPCLIWKIKVTKNETLNEHRKTTHEGKRYFSNICNKAYR